MQKITGMCCLAKMTFNKPQLCGYHGTLSPSKFFLKGQLGGKGKGKGGVAAPPLSLWRHLA